MTYNPYKQSSTPYGAGSHYPTPTATPAPTPPGYAPGATQSTISQPGPGVVNPLYASLSQGLSRLKKALSSWSSQSSSKSRPSSGGYSGGGGTILNQPTSFSRQGSWGGGAPAPPVVQQPSTYIDTATQQSFAKPISGLASELTTDEEKKKKYNTLQKSITSEVPGVPTRTSLKDRLTDFFSPQDTSKLTGSMVDVTSPTQMTTTGTTTPPEQEWSPSPSLSEYLGQQPYSTTDTPMTSRPTIDTTPPATPLGEKPTAPVIPETADTNVWGPPQQQISDIIKGLEKFTAQYSAQMMEIQATVAKAALDPGWTPEQAAKMYEPIVQQANAMYPQFESLQSNITEIDKVLLDASIGFRKSAEALRNNPDLSMWQQTRRLKELDDMQNYAPIFNGLSMRDLISYRNQLSENMNYYSGLISDATKGITGLVDFTTPYERMVKASSALGDIGTWSSSAIEAMKGLSGLLIPTYLSKYETNNATGEVTKITYRVDPITKQETEASRENVGAIGQRTVTSGSTGGDTVDEFEDMTLEKQAELIAQALSSS